MKRTIATVPFVLAALAAGCGSGGTPAAASCDQAAFLPILQDAFDNTAEELRVVRADVRRCRSGYARVLAVPDPSVCEPGVEHCYETEQVFLRHSGGAWRILTSGTGIGCEDVGLSDELLVACRALGYAAP